MVPGKFRKTGTSLDFAVERFQRTRNAEFLSRAAGNIEIQPRDVLPIQRSERAIFLTRIASGSEDGTHGAFRVGSHFFVFFNFNCLSH